MKKIFIDYEKCLGCGLCELACSFEKKGIFNPTLSRMSVTRFYKDGFYIPMVCQQCGKPPCEKICPVNAISRDEKTGAMLIDEAKCMGCQMCRMVCPISAPIWDEDRTLVIKCDLCEGKPQCVEACVVGALEYIDESEANVTRKVATAEKLAKLTSFI